MEGVNVALKEDIMTKSKKSKEQSPESNPTLKRLDALVGEWEIQASMGEQPLGRARATFEWLEGGAFLIQHADEESAPLDASPEWIANSPMPVTTIIGLDDASETFIQLYADARGVYRVYQMSLDGGVWQLWRDAPGFSQRFKGTFSNDDQTITGSWEYSNDGSTWEHDFDLTYTKVG